MWQLVTAVDTSADQPTSTTVELIADLAPLDAQLDIIERKCVPDTLHASLFGPLGDKTPACFAILDAAKIHDLPELLIGSGLEHKCLFTGDALDELGHVAPWIVRLEDGNNFTRALFTQTDPPTPWTHWAKDAGIYLRSTASLEDLWAHFRKFTKVRVEGLPDDHRGAWQYFRFYDPEQAAIYFDAIRAWPDRMAQFYRLTDGTLVDRIIAICSIEGTAHVFAPDIDAMVLQRPQPFIFQPRDALVFKSARRPRFRKELADWLLRMDPARFKPFSEDQLYALVDHGLREGDDYGFTFKEEYVYLLYMMSYFGGWFHKSGRMPEITRILTEDGTAREPNLRAEFPQTFTALYGNARQTYAGWAVLFGRMDAHLQKHGGWQDFTPDAARRLIAAGTGHLNDEDRARLATFLARVELDCDQRGILGAPGRGISLLLSYMMGHSFFADPLFPWASDIAVTHSTLEPALPEIADYAMKRGRKMLAEFQQGAA